MTREADFSPDWISPPGETISDLLRQREIPASDCADNLGLTPERFQDLLDGRTPITLSLARNLSAYIGASMEFWMTRDHHYRDDARRRSEQFTEWLQQLPVADMVKFGWIPRHPRPEAEAEACLDFFGMTTLREWQSRYLTEPAIAAFRGSPSYDSTPGAVAAWLRQAERLARTVDTQDWDPVTLRKNLRALRRLTRIKAPTRFVPQLRKECAGVGVAVVCLPTPAGCPASGAAMLASGKAIIALSFRHLSDDHFWFTFFHEVAHLVLHGDRMYVDSDANPSTPVEREANEFASNVLIPPDLRPEFDRLRPRVRDIVRFAYKAGVSPGVVVGQMQFAGRIGFDRLNALKRRYKWDGDTIRGMA